MRYAFANHIFSWPPHRRGGPPPPAADRRLQHYLVRQAGFDGLELGDFWTDFYRLPDDDLTQLRREAEAANLPIVALNCLRRAITPSECASANQADLERAVAVAEHLGAMMINISLAMPHALIGQTTDLDRGRPTSAGSSRQASPGEYARAADFLRRLADRAASSGRQLTIELHHNSIADTGATVARLVGLIDRPNVGGNPDLGNLLWAYEMPEETADEALGHILAAGMNFWHVKNLQRLHLGELARSQFVHAAIPDGDIDYRAAMLKVLRHGYDGWLSLEGAGPGDVLAFAERGLTHLRRLEAELRPWLAAEAVDGTPGP